MVGSLASLKLASGEKRLLFPINECKGFFVPAQTITLVGLYPTIARDT